MASKQPISQLIMCRKGTVGMILPYSTQAVAFRFAAILHRHTLSVLMSKAGSRVEAARKQPTVWEKLFLVEEIVKTLLAIEIEFGV